MHARQKKADWLGDTSGTHYAVQLSKYDVNGKHLITFPSQLEVDAAAGR